MKDKKLTTYQMAVTAVMAAVLCVLGPLTVPIGAVPISLANFVICLTAWLLGPKFGTLSVVIYLVLGAIGIPVFSGYGAGLAKPIPFPFISAQKNLTVSGIFRMSPSIVTVFCP